MVNRKPRLLTTGITPLPKKVSAAMRRPMVDGHGAEAWALMESVRQGLADVLETKSEIFLLPGTGTGGLEAALVNHLSRGDHVLACTHGFFSGLFAAMAEKLGAAVETMVAEPGKGVDWAALERRLQDDRKGKIKAILLTHHETSTGVLNDLAQLAAAKGKHPALVLVNALSSAGGVPLLPDLWGLDVTVMCSHKGLMCAPGLAFLAIGQRAKERWKTAGMAKAYWDLSHLAHWLSRGITPFDPPLTLIYGMVEVMGYLRDKEARVQAYRRTASNAFLFRSYLPALRGKCVAAPKDRAPNATVFRLAGETHCEDIKKALLSDFNISISRGMGTLAESTLRVNHQGWVFPKDIMALGEAMTSLTKATYRENQRGSVERPPECSLESDERPSHEA